eukprot:TRINITY_DN66217_c0_g1_i1.p1 TRINITY_DN66217_c0_g1~~TRINITY_DN66217_c0_g1_i1.p1  ORF type:complete len:224 (+),score=46.94 TRINITY_DN66217_c0_g1_i1:51-722(+)
MEEPSSPVKAEDQEEVHATTLRKVFFASSPASSQNDGHSPAESLKRRLSRKTSIGAHGIVSVPARAGLCEQQVQGLREVFGLFDTEGSGRVSPSAVRQAASDAGLQRDAPEVWRLLGSLEDGEGSSVDFEEFIALLTEPLGDRCSKRGTSRFLNLMRPEADATGFVCLDDLKRLVDDLGIEMGDADLEDLLEKAGAGADGQLSLDAFYAVMLRSDSEKDKVST